MLETVAKTFDFSGIASRRAFWSYAALVFGVYIVAGIVSSSEPLTKALLVVVPGFVGLPFIALTARRLHDTGRTGWWAILNGLPVVGPIVLLLFCAMKSQGQAKTDWPDRSIHRLGQLAVLLLGLAYLSRFVWAPYWIPSGSMKPTLLPGDYLIATLWQSDTEPGDIVVFREETGVEFIFRVVAVGGDTVEMKDGALVLNGTAVESIPGGTFTEPRIFQGPARALPICKDRAETTPCEKDIQIETLPNGATYQTLDIGPSRLDTTNTFTVPEGHVFVLGDHRDNANDSRVPTHHGGRGFIPASSITAHASLILFSSEGALIDVTSWRAGRFFKRPN